VEGNSHIKRKGGGGSSYLLRVKNAVFGTCCGVQPHNVHSGSFCGNFQGIEPKKYERRYLIIKVIKNDESVSECVVLELPPLRGEKNSKPRPQSRILVRLRGSFKISDENPRRFSMGVPPDFPDLLRTM